MVTLNCVIVNVKGSAFPVDIDADKSVGGPEGRDQDEETERLEGCRCGQTAALPGEDDRWRVDDGETSEGRRDTKDLTLLDFAGAPLNLVGLSEEGVWFRLTKEDVKAGKVPVHVLVVVPSYVERNREGLNGGYLSFWGDLLSLLWPLDKVHSTKKDV